MYEQVEPLKRVHSRLDTWLTRLWGRAPPGSTKTTLEPHKQRGGGANEWQAEWMVALLNILEKRCPLTRDAYFQKIVTEPKIHLTYCALMKLNSTYFVDHANPNKKCVCFSMLAAL